MFGRSLLIPTTALAALALPVTPALATYGPPPAKQSILEGSLSGSGSIQSILDGSLTGKASIKSSSPMRASEDCEGQAQASVTGRFIDSVTFYLNGKKVKTATKSDASGAYTLKVSCRQLGPDAWGKAVVDFKGDKASTHGTLEFKMA